MRRAGVTAGALALGGAPRGHAEPAAGGWRMPDEGDPHVRTWMAFGASRAIWGHDLLPEVQADLGRIARTIARYEPVTMLVREHERELAREHVGDAVELVTAPLDDLWMRDTGPMFVLDGRGNKAAVGLNFNGWGGKQAHGHDRAVAGRVAEWAGVPLHTTPLVLEGGCVEVDGHGTAIVTESCTLNPNRNPGVSKAEFERHLSESLGLEKIVWLDGVRGQDITDGHTDFYARFARPGVVLAGFEPDRHSPEHAVTRGHLDALRRATDAAGRRLEVVPLNAPTDLAWDELGDDFAAGYVGFYLCNGAVIVQAFGDREADDAARAVLADAYPDRVVEPIRIDAIAAGGGSVHCATQQEPAAG